MFKDQEQSVMDGSRMKRIALYLIGAIILMFGAFFNWYPFFTGDTSVYINSGFQLYVPTERPIFYGLFIRFTSLGFSLWLTAFAQNLLLSYVLIKFISKMWSSVQRWQIVLILMLIGIFTGVWWESSKLIPDVFIAIMAMGLLNLSFFENKRTEKIILLAIVLISAIVHLSHLAVLLGFVLWILSFNPFQLRKNKKLLASLSLVVVLGFASLIGSNMLNDGSFSLAKGNKVFLLGKLNEAGILDTYLNENCGKKDLALCAYKDSLPATAWQFVWGSQSPVMKLGGWEPNREEHSEIVSDILSSPGYWPMLIYKSIMATAVQATQTNVGDNLFRQEKGSNSLQSIERYYPHEKNAALWTRQFLLELPFRNMSWFYLLSMLVIIVLYVDQKARKAISTHFNQTVLGLLVLILLNAFFTANLANISSRLNERILWLLPALILVDLMLKRFQKPTKS